MVNQGGVVIKSSKTLLFGFLILVFLFVCYFFSFDVSSYVDELSIAFDSFYSACAFCLYFSLIPFFRV